MSDPLFRDPITNDPWHAHFHAIGALTVAWNGLEHTLEYIIGALLRLDHDTASFLITNLGNVSRADLAKRLIRTNDGRTQIIELVDHLAKGYNTCRENRNIILHSQFTINALASKAWLVKPTRSGALNEYPADLSTLRQVATEVATFAGFAVDIFGAIQTDTDHVGASDSKDPQVAVWPWTWPNKPPLPRNLNPHQSD